MIHKNKFYWLDLLRGLAALLVFLSHIRVLYFFDFPDIEQHIGSILLYFITGFGHSAVILFFVLSGFFIIRSIDQAVDRGRWSVSGYLIDRLSRLWVALIPALLFTFLTDKLGTTLFPHSLAYLGQIESLKEVNPSNTTNLATFWGNIFFLQTILVPTFGSNTPLWSLTYEFWYYLIFPIMYFAVLDKGKYGMRIGYVLLSVLLLFFVGRKIALYYIIWLMGGFVYIIHKWQRWSYFGQPRSLIILIILLASILTSIRLQIYPLLFNSYSLGIATSLLSLSLLQFDMKSALMCRIATFLSNISFTLYLVHMPLSILLTSALFRQRQALSFSTFSLFLVLCSGIIYFSYIFWLLFERQTPQVRDWVREKLWIKVRRFR